MLLRIKRFRRSLVSLVISRKWPRWSGSAKQENVRSNKTKDERRQQEHVEHEEAGKGYRAHFRTAAQQALERSSDHWNVSQDVGAHRSEERRVGKEGVSRRTKTADR